MAMHGVLAQRQLGGDLLVAEPPGHEGENLRFARREPVVFVRRRRHLRHSPALLRRGAERRECLACELELPVRGVRAPGGPQRPR